MNCIYRLAKKGDTEKKRRHINKKGDIPEVTTPRNNISIN